MRMMITLIGDAPVEPVDTYLARTTKVLAKEHLADEGAILSSIDKATPFLSRDISEIRALWIVDAARDTATEILRGAPGDDGILELRESFTSEDFGGPPDPTTLEPTPPVPRLPETHRYIALVRADAHNETGITPKGAAVDAMAAYMEAHVATHTFAGGEGLKASMKGTRVRRSAAQRFVLDGPFTESKELVGGYLIVQAPSLDAAIDLVRPWLQIHRDHQPVPSSHIEVRLLR